MRGRYATLLLLAVVPLTQAAADEVNRLKLRPHAVVFDAQATLGDVLVLSDADGALLEAIANVPLEAPPRVDGRQKVTHQQIVRQLDALGVNLARVLVSGAWECEILYRKPARLRQARDTAPLIRKTGAASHDTTERTLAEQLRRYVQRELAELGGTAEIEFERSGQEFLSLTTPPWDFNITGSGRDLLGLREFRVVIRRDGRTQRIARIFAHVRMKRQVVVATRPLSIGNNIAHDDVKLESRVFDAGDDYGLASVTEAIGQQVEQFVPAGAMVAQNAIKAVDLVQRSRPVTVLGAGDGVQIRLTGTALDSGGFGDSVRVRLGNSRGNRRMLRGVVSGLATVRIEEAGS